VKLCFAVVNALYVPTVPVPFNATVTEELCTKIPVIITSPSAEGVTVAAAPHAVAFPLVWFDPSAGDTDVFTPLNCSTHDARPVVADVCENVNVTVSPL
jgi:hypothetical protein